MTTDSAVRRLLLWWFAWPSNPYVTVNFVVDFAPARAWLASLAEPRVTVNALLAAAVARTLRRHPQANAHVVGHRIVREPRVGVATMVNLLDAPGPREVAVALLEGADEMSLRELGARLRERVGQERGGEPHNPFIRGITRLAERAPRRVVFQAFDAMDAAMRRPAVARRFYDAVPATTALSNAGAAFSTGPGVWFRGADVAIPQRLVHVGTFWGVSAVQDEVVPVDGVPTVRPVLPVVLLFDHRLIDGVLGSRVVRTFSEILRDPAAEFGPTGDAPPR